MRSLRALRLGIAVALSTIGLTACDFENSFSTSYTLRTCFDIPANWNADYYSWRLHQPFTLDASRLKAKIAIKTPKGLGQPPTQFTWTLVHLDEVGTPLDTLQIPGDIKVRMYNGKASLDVALPAYEFAAGHELLVQGSFNGFVPSDTIFKTRIKLSF